MEVRRRQRRKSSSAAVYVPVAVLVIIFIWVFGTSVFFKVTGIEVEGALRYKAEEVINAAGIMIGDNLLLIDVNTAVIKLRAELPYIEEITIKREYPDTIVIAVKESRAIATVNAEGAQWVIDETGRVLEKTSAETSAETRELIVVRGITVTKAEIGRRIEVSAEEEPRVGSMQEVLRAITESGLQGEVSELNVSNISNVTFTYLGRITVALGSSDNIGYKLTMLKDVISKLEDKESARGTVLLSSNSPRFIPAQ